MVNIQVTYIVVPHLPFIRHGGLFLVVSLLLCLIYKVNFIIGM